MTTVLKLSSVSKQFGVVRALSDVSFAVKTGDVVLALCIS